jgi:hypothetical protein
MHLSFPPYVLMKTYWLVFQNDVGTASAFWHTYITTKYHRVTGKLNTVAVAILTVGQCECTVGSVQGSVCKKDQWRHRLSSQLQKHNTTEAKSQTLLDLSEVRWVNFASINRYLSAPFSYNLTNQPHEEQPTVSQLLKYPSLLRNANATTAFTRAWICQYEPD